MVLIQWVRGIYGLGMRGFWFRLIVVLEKESRIPLNCLRLGSCIVLFLKYPSNSFMVTENSSIGHIVTIEQILVRSMYSGVHVVIPFVSARDLDKGVF